MGTKRLLHFSKSLAGCADAGGELTPRMYYALTMAAAAGTDALRADAQAHFVDGKPGGHFWRSDCLPEVLRKQVFKAFVLGMSEVASVIGALLESKQMPTLEAASDALSPFSGKPLQTLGLRVNRHLVSHFFSKGGSVEHVLRAVVDEATAFYEAREDTQDA